jgi:hypothetical protein
MIDKLGLDGLGGASVRVEPDRGLLGRIDDLQAELAASQAREQQLREALKAIQQGFAVTHQVNAVVVHALALPQDDTALNTLLAAGQVREQQLREALEICKKEMQGDKWDSLYIDGVLSLPQDYTALREWGAKLLREVAKGGCTHVHVLRKADELEAGK